MFSDVLILYLYKTSTRYVTLMSEKPQFCLTLLPSSLHQSCCILILYFFNVILISKKRNTHPFKFQQNDHPEYNYNDAKSLIIQQLKSYLSNCCHFKQCLQGWDLQAQWCLSILSHAYWMIQCFQILISRLCYWNQYKYTSTDHEQRGCFPFPFQSSQANIEWNFLKKMNTQGPYLWLSWTLHIPSYSITTIGRFFLGIPDLNSWMISNLVTLLTVVVSMDMILITKHKVIDLDMIPPMFLCSQIHFWSFQ